MALTEEQKAERAAKRRMTEALAAEARAHRDEAKRREWAEKKLYLTREEAIAGGPCRGCGLPVIDNLGDWPPTMHLTPEERPAYDAAEADYRERHASCGSHRWSMQGSRAQHCGFCCPPIPMSQSQYERLGRLLSGFSKPRDEELDIWERTLTCGHRVEQGVHHTNSGPSFSTQWCPECEVTRGVVTSEKIMTAAARAAEAKHERDQKLAQAEREVAKAERAAAAARKKLEALRADR